MASSYQNMGQASKNKPLYKSLKKHLSTSKQYHYQSFYNETIMDIQARYSIGDKVTLERGTWRVVQHIASSLTFTQQLYLSTNHFYVSTTPWNITTPYYGPQH